MKTGFWCSGNLGPFKNSLHMYVQMSVLSSSLAFSLFVCFFFRIHNVDHDQRRFLDTGLNI